MNEIAEKQLTPKEIYALTYKACATDEGIRPVLGCVFIDEGRLIASDGYRMHVIHHVPTWPEWAAIHFRRWNAHPPPEPPSPTLWPCSGPGIRANEDYPDYKSVTGHPPHSVTEVPLADVQVLIRASHTLDHEFPTVNIHFDGYPEKVAMRWGETGVGNIARLQSDYLADALVHHHRHSDTVRFEALGVEFVGNGPIRIETFGMTAYIMGMHIPARREET